MDKVVTVNNLLIVGKTFSKLSILIHFGTLVVLFKSPYFLYILEQEGQCLVMGANILI